MRPLMVQGTSSGAGKSVLATALCRHFARQGVRVAPFKAQNVSNNARVAAGGEMGAAQYLQALAARVTPDVRMNPVLVKPEAGGRSQVVVLGRADPQLSALPWPERSARLWPVAAEALTGLQGEHELVVLEGAGSPAEPNLAGVDMTNARAAAAADAAVLLVADIERGGAFAHLYGTWALLAEADRARVRGFVLNRFHGDPALLGDAPARLQALTGVPVVGVVPWLAHDLPEEDALADPRGTGASARAAVVLYPTASNLDELGTLGLRPARTPEDLTHAELVVLPGAKDVPAALEWLRASGVADAVLARARAGARVLGICGGMQLLGERVGDAAGLGLLPIATTFAPEKLVARTRAQFARLDEPWAALSGRAFDGYEIRQGRSTATGPAQPALDDGRGWVRGPVLGIAVHGVLEDPALAGALLGGAAPVAHDAAIDALADAVVAGLDLEAIERLSGARA